MGGARGRAYAIDGEIWYSVHGNAVVLMNMGRAIKTRLRRRRVKQSGENRHSAQNNLKRIRLKRDKSEQKRTKPDKNGKRSEAEKSLKQLQLKEEEKRRKQKKNGRKRIHGSKVIKLLKKRRNKRARIEVLPNYNHRD
nr:hypothetical protein [Tanacetum cinerariifolium]